jgi:hypothetical protein
MKTINVNDYNWLRNDYVCNGIVVNGITYPSVEFAFQAAKTNDPLIKQQIAKAFSVKEAKRIGRSVSLNPNWDDIRGMVMEGLLRKKFTYNDDLANHLINTDDATIICAGYDEYWGTGKNGAGDNILGQILELIRDELRLEQGMDVVDYSDDDEDDEKYDDEVDDDDKRNDCNHYYDYREEEEEDPEDDDEEDDSCLNDCSNCKYNIDICSSQTEEPPSLYEALVSVSGENDLREDELVLFELCNKLLLGIEGILPEKSSLTTKDARVLAQQLGVTQNDYEKSVQNVLDVIFVVKDIRELLATKE